MENYQGFHIFIYMANTNSEQDFLVLLNSLEMSLIFGAFSITCCKNRLAMNVNVEGYKQGYFQKMEK